MSQGDSACWKLSAFTVTAVTVLANIMDEAAISDKAPIFEVIAIFILSPYFSLIDEETISSRGIKSERP